MLVLEPTESFDLFLDHLVADLLVSEVEVLDGHFITCELVLAHVDLTKTAFAQVLFELEGINADAVIEVVSQRIEKSLLLEQVLHVKLCKLNTLDGKETH